MAAIRVKICGLRRRQDVAAAVEAGAAYVGFNFYPRTPRFVDMATARDLAVAVPPGVAKVALTVNASDDEMAEIVDRVPVDMLQLHGDESAERVEAVRARFGLPVMKVVGIGDEGDLAALDEHMRVANQILVDARPPRGADRPGGNAVAFDWRLIAGRRWPIPWMLAGGLTAQNVAEAIHLTGARQVDVASGVESAPGEKDPALIAAFIAAAQG